MAQTKRAILLHSLRGEIGKQFVVKQYGKKTVVTAYPDMSRVRPSKLQKLKRSRFAEAVAFAQDILQHPAKKAAFAKTLQKGERLYTAAIRKYLADH
jgi:hypothetical protein